MMFRFKPSSGTGSIDLLSSKLYNEQSFYSTFLVDVQRASSSIIIESPFITYRRFQWLFPDLQKAIRKGVKVVINTRDPMYHDEAMQSQAQSSIDELHNIGVTILYTGNHHRKIAIIDQKILWEGSLNILSQADSCEMMRRIDSAVCVADMIKFTGLAKWYT